jgi:hypothetical protein
MQLSCLIIHKPKLVLKALCLSVLRIVAKRRYVITTCIGSEVRSSAIRYHFATTSKFHLLPPFVSKLTQQHLTLYRVPLASDMSHYLILPSFSLPEYLDPASSRQPLLCRSNLLDALRILF